MKSAERPNTFAEIDKIYRQEQRRRATAQDADDAYSKLKKPGDRYGIYFPTGYYGMPDWSTRNDAFDRGGVVQAFRGENRPTRGQH